jgi:hypothetical protein
LRQQFARTREITLVHEDLAPTAELQPSLCGEIGDAVSARDLLGTEHSTQDLGFALVRDDRQADDFSHNASFADRSASPS